jgi:probable aminopeptidase NPEPL1
VIQGEELKERRGMGGIYGVGKAAIHQPALAVLSFEIWKVTGLQIKL